MSSEQDELSGIVAEIRDRVLKEEGDTEKVLDGISRLLGESGYPMEFEYDSRDIPPPLARVSNPVTQAVALVISRELSKISQNDLPLSDTERVRLKKFAAEIEVIFGGIL